MGSYLVMYRQHGGRKEEEEDEPILYRIGIQFYVYTTHHIDLEEFPIPMIKSAIRPT